MTWQEKAKFYTQHGHLPYVASEKEVIDKGLSLGEMMSGMMRNIEEDRLDITELFERLEMLEKENIEFKEKLKSAEQR